jgi:hypothetical protein
MGTKYVFFRMCLLRFVVFLIASFGTIENFLFFVPRPIAES